MTSPTITRRPPDSRGCPASSAELVRRREREWARDAAGTLAVSEPVADLVQRRWGVPRPIILHELPAGLAPG